jgi:hypothetical protein
LTVLSLPGSCAVSPKAETLLARQTGLCVLSAGLVPASFVNRISSLSALENLTLTLSPDASAAEAVAALASLSHLTSCRPVCDAGDVSRSAVAPAEPLAYSL